MDENSWLVGCAALAAVLVGFVWSERSSSRQRKARSQRRETKKVAEKPIAPKRNPPPILNSAHPDDDVEITLITTFPLEQIARARAAQADDGAPSLTADPAVATDAELSAELNATRVELSYEDEADVEEVTSPVVRILVSAAGDSDQGRMRARNEDSMLAFAERSLFAVADGMGGHAGGEVASALAVDVLRDAFERNVFDARTECTGDVPRRGRELACAIQMANEAIYALGQSDPALNNMGTTVVSARFSPNKQRVYIGHVGDSRCYRLRDSTLRQLTKDHTMSTLGVTGPRGNDLYQAVGVQPTLSIDLIVDKPRGDDLYLLCSDGLSKMVSDDEVRDMLVNEPDLEAAIYGLMELANDRGGRDNITLILVKVLERPVKSLAHY